MHAGLFLFTWPDGYFLDVELKKRQASFIEKFWKENCLTYTSDNIQLASLQEALQWGGLFASKKLLVCKWIPDDKIGTGKAPAQIIKFFEWLLGGEEIILSPDVLLVFVSIDPDKRLKLYKILSEKATVKSFAALSEWQTKTFLQQKLETYYSDDIADYLIQYVGTDLFRLEKEADKITTYLKEMWKTALSEEERSAIIYTPIQVNAFGVLDAILSNNLKEANRLIDASAQSMTPWPEFLGMLYWWFKHMLQTVDLYNHGTKSAKDIASVIGMHFFPIVKNLKYIDNLKAKYYPLQKTFHQLLELDSSIKSGRYPQEWFWTETKNIIFTNLG